MKKILIYFFALAIVTQVSAQGEVAFFEGTWQEAFEKAKKENKHVFVDSYTDWCYWCKVMDKETFTDEKIAAYLNEEFVPIKVNMEKDFGIDVAMKFRVRAFPTSLYFSPDGELQVKQPGYEPDNDKFLDFLKEIRSDQKSKPFAFASQDFDLDYPEFYKKIYGERKDKERPKQEDVDAWLASQKDLTGEVAWSVLTQCPTDEKYKSEILGNAEKYASMYGSEEFEDFVISRVVYPQISKAGKEKDKAMYDAALVTLNKYIKDEESVAQMTDNFEMGYLRAIGDWKGYTMKADEKLKSKPLDEQLGFANGVAWTLYEKCEDPKCLKMMEEWMNKVIELDPKYMYIDTYAALLYKNGDLKEAKKYALKAIEVGEKEESDTAETKALLDKIEQSEGE